MQPIMQDATHDLDQLTREYGALMRDYGRVQLRCTQQLREQTREIDRLHAQVMRLRANVILGVSRLAWARGDLQFVSRTDDGDALERSLRTADLVICQTGCLSHGAYWRVQDHCKRTGKTCVLVEEPDAVRIVRIHKTEAGDGAVHADIAPEEAD